MVTTVYLLVYNCIQCSSFLLILVNIVLLTLKGEGKCWNSLYSHIIAQMLLLYPHSVRNVYEVTSTMMRFCVLLSVLEIVHVQLKLVKASLLPTMVQVSKELSVCSCMSCVYTWYLYT